MDKYKKFPMCQGLHENPAKHCAALVMTQDVLKKEDGSLSLAQPSDELRNGTLTFVKSSNKVYGITCWHVVKHFRGLLSRQRQQDETYSMRTMVNGFYVVGDRFVRPQPQFCEPEVDVAICELDPAFVIKIGKLPIDLDAQAPTPEDIKYGYAVGFPENMKDKKWDVQHFGYRVSMPQVEILAELPGAPNGRFTLFSELNDQPSQTDYSGMSGGPIFWSTGDVYGILGIIYEGGVGSARSDGSSVYVFGELATPPVIKGWLSQLNA